MKTTGNLLFAVALVAIGFAMGTAYKPTDSGESNGGSKSTELTLTTEQSVGRWMAGQLTKSLSDAASDASKEPTSEAADKVFGTKSEEAMRAWFGLVSGQLDRREKEEGEKATELLREWSVGMEAAK